MQQSWKGGGGREARRPRNITRDVTILYLGGGKNKSTSTHTKTAKNVRERRSLTHRNMKAGRREGRRRGENGVLQVHSRTSYFHFLPPYRARPPRPPAGQALAVPALSFTRRGASQTQNAQTAREREGGGGKSDQKKRMETTIVVENHHR